MLNQLARKGHEGSNPLLSAMQFPYNHLEVLGIKKLKPYIPEKKMSYAEGLYKFWRNKELEKFTDDELRAELKRREDKKLSEANKVISGSAS